jgi:hypothetical protein
MFGHEQSVTIQQVNDVRADDWSGGKANVQNMHIATYKAIRRANVASEKSSHRLYAY